MRKVAVAAATLTFLLGVFLAPAYSQDATSSSSPRERAQELRQQKMEQGEGQATREARRLEIQQTRAEKRAERIHQFLQRLTTRLEAMADRLQRLINRIQSRIDKIKESGEDIDTSDAEAELESAQASLDGAKTAIEELKGKTVEDILVMIGDDHPREAFKALRDQIIEIKKDLVETHRSLVKVIGELKGLRVGQNEGGE